MTIEGGKRHWRTQSSGVQIPGEIGEQLESLVVGKPPKPISRDVVSNPDWTRDELIVALSFYLGHRPNPPGKDSKEIADLSLALNRLGELLFPQSVRSPTFRNENGVYMKLMNFRRLDPQYTVGGRTGLERGAKAEEEVWSEFADDPVRCEQVANAILASLEDTKPGAAPPDTDEDIDFEEAPEGRLLTRRHVVRERNRKLIQAKRKHVFRKCGKLECEACGFDFAVGYGSHGSGFIECHHIKPVVTLAPGSKTHISDLALLCANCHRMVHRHKPWLSVAQLKALIKSARLA